MALKFSPIFRFKVQGQSMEPAYKHGTHVYVSRLAYLLVDPEPGEVIVLNHPKGSVPIIKRVKEVFEEGYFVVGDNLDQSTDSRHFGKITKDHIIGKVMEI